MQENERKEQQAQDISEEMISQENISWEIGEEEPAEDTQEQGLLNITFIPKYMDIFDGLCATDQADGTGKRARMEIGEEEPAEDTQEQGLLNITFIPKYMDIFDGLCATDQADGTGKRARMLFVVLVLLMCVQLVGFFSTQNGFMFVFALLLGGVALFIKKKSQRFNRDIAIAFEKEGEQHLVFEENSFHLNEKQVSYDEVVHLYELKKVFSIIYQGNHVYILPKAVMEPQQTEQFVALMKEKVSAVYEQCSK